jgi:polyhydroxyalkanoate synthesis regulator phasin
MKPGHTVQFTGLKGAAHLNGTEGTLVRFDKAQQRWAVRCDSDQQIVNARPENLVVKQIESEAPPPRRGGGSGRGYGAFGGGSGDGAFSAGPTMESVLSAGRGADCKEEYYLRTLMTLAQQAEAANQQGHGSNAQELVVDAIGALVDRGELDGDAGERFVRHLHRRTREEEAAGRGNAADIMGFIDTVLLSKIMDRLSRQAAKRGRRAVVPKWLRGSLAGSMAFGKSMEAERGIRAAAQAASDITRVVDEEEDDEMEIPNISED